MKNILTVCLTALIGLCACQSSWTEEERAAFGESCQGAAEQAGDGWPKQTCDCLAQKLEARYPNPNEMEDLLDSLRQNPLLLFERNPDCRQRAFETPVDWTPKAESAFIGSCQTLMAKGQIADSAVCPCVLAKVKQRFVTTQQMNRLNAGVMQALAEECGGKRDAQMY